MKLIKVLSGALLFLILSVSHLYSDNNFKWQKVGTIECNRIESFAFNPAGDIFAVSYSRSDSGAGWSFKASCSTDNGNTWTDILRYGWQSIFVTVNNENHIYAGGWGIVQKSIDNGNTWHTTNDSLPIAAIHTINFSSDGYIYLGANGGNYRSIDGGYIWEELNLVHQAYSYLFKDDSTIFSSVNTGIYPNPEQYICRSTDNGTTWNVINSSVKTAPWIIALSKKGHLIAAVNPPDADSGSVICSEDNGDSWYSINGDLPTSDINDLKIDNNDKLYISIINYGIYCSEDYGETWNELNNGLPEYDINCIGINSENEVYAGSNLSGSIYKYSLTSPVNGTDKQSPSVFSLKQNYPNPFNGETIIHYQIPAMTNVTLQIFNINGQIIRTLVNEEKSPGSYGVRWNGKNDNGLTAAGGIYFYRLRANNYTDTKKLVFLK